jgi:hypothetical protein
MFYTIYYFYKTDQCFLWAEHVASKEINAHQVSAKHQKEWDQLEKNKSRWESYIKMELREKVSQRVDKIRLLQDRE